MRPAAMSWGGLTSCEAAGCRVMHARPDWRMLLHTMSKVIHATPRAVTMPRASFGAGPVCHQYLQRPRRRSALHCVHLHRPTVRAVSSSWATPSVTSMPLPLLLSSMPPTARLIRGVAGAYVGTVASSSSATIFLPLPSVHMGKSVGGYGNQAHLIATCSALAAPSHGHIGAF